VEETISVELKLGVIPARYETHARPRRFPLTTL